LSDDEEEMEHNRKCSSEANGQSSVAAMNEATTVGTTPAIPNQDKDGLKQADLLNKKRALGGGSMGSILARMNRPKKKKKKSKGGVLDRSIARLLNGSDAKLACDSQAAKRAASAALAIAGKMKVEEQVRFAGQTIKVSRTVEKSSMEAKNIIQDAEKEKGKSALDKIVGELKNPKKALSAVEKSTYDWDKYKDEKGLNEQLQDASKDGYVEKQQFLQRVDMRKFELEREERERARAKAAAAAAAAKK